MEAPDWVVERHAERTTQRYGMTQVSPGLTPSHRQSGCLILRSLSWAAGLEGPEVLGVHL